MRLFLTGSSWNIFLKCGCLCMAGSRWGTGTQNCWSRQEVRASGIEKGEAAVNVPPAYPEWVEMRSAGRSRQAARWRVGEGGSPGRR